VLPKQLQEENLCRSPSGGTISFDQYVSKKLYRNLERQKSIQVKSREQIRESRYLLKDFPQTPDEIPSSVGGLTNYNGWVK
jgi:hypothetical protein